MTLSIKKSKKDKIFDIINYTILGIVLLCVIYPIYFVLIASISDPISVAEGSVILLPKNITLEGYVRIFMDDTILVGYRNTLLYTTLGIILGVSFTSGAAFALSRKELKFRKLVLTLLTFTMFFNGGLIPTYLVIKNLGLIDSMWAILLPGAVWVYNIFIMRTFFTVSIPEELYESAMMDGCSQFRYFFSILMPLSKAILAVMTLFYGMAVWNMFFQPMIYLTDENKFPLQLILRNILLESDVSGAAVLDADTVAKRTRISELLKYTVVMVSIIPPLIIYPFLQKYFTQGTLSGSVKG
ncbi:MAG: carbohydrate ABC transporter permease [Spirochaetaceae bacterium]